MRLPLGSFLISNYFLNNAYNHVQAVSIFLAEQHCTVCTVSVHAWHCSPVRHIDTSCILKSLITSGWLYNWWGITRQGIIKSHNEKHKKKLLKILYFIFDRGIDRWCILCHKSADPNYFRGTAGTKIRENFKMWIHINMDLIFWII